MSIPVFDLHCDTALALLGDALDQAGSLRKNDLHIDLERAGSLGGYCQCFACFTTPGMEKWYKKSRFRSIVDMHIPSGEGNLEAFDAEKYADIIISTAINKICVILSPSI